MLWNYKDCKIGDQIPTLEIDALQQSDLILYAKASGDHNQIHTDPVFAKKSGLPNVIAHGMLVMSFLGRMLTNLVPHSNIVNFSVQFSNMTHLNQALVCKGKVVERSLVDNKEMIRVKLIVEDMEGQKKLLGHSSIRIES